MIEVGMTDPDHTEKILSDFGCCRMASDDDMEVVIYIYLENQVDLISTLAQLAIYHHIEWCHPHQRDLTDNYAMLSAYWSWIE